MKLKAHQLSSGSLDLENVGVPQIPPSPTEPNTSDGARHNIGKRVVIVTPGVGNEKERFHISERDT